ncbi:MAG TPA: YceI family protein [Bacteroidales bacterium]|nr:YceI family protein [Bacteroidales bacterium]
MKTKLALSVMFLATLFVVSCGGPQGEKAVTSDEKTAMEAKGDSFLADVDNSMIEWIGTKPTGQHNGVISLAKGYVSVENGKITGGEMIIDMSSIVNHDLTDSETNANLVGHLLSPDFFDVENYPEARFEFTSVSENEGVQTGENAFTHFVSGNLTMKDATRNVAFPVNIEIRDGVVKAVTDNFIIDRSEWNVKYGSRKFFDNLKDNFIHDEISLKISFVGLKG